VIAEGMAAHLRTFAVCAALPPVTMRLAGGCGGGQDPTFSDARACVVKVSFRWKNGQR